MFIPTWVIFIAVLLFACVCHHDFRLSRSNYRIRKKYNAVAHTTRNWWNEMSDSESSYLKHINIVELELLNEKLKLRGMDSIELQNAIKVMQDINVGFEKFEKLPVLHEYDE